MDDLYTVFVIDGDLASIVDPLTACLRFDKLTREEVEAIAQKAFLQGYMIAAWKENRGK